MRPILNEVVMLIGDDTDADLKWNGFVMGIKFAKCFWVVSNCIVRPN